MSRLRGDLRAITADGAVSSVMVGLGEAYLPAFVLALTASQVASGLVGTLPMFLGALLQLVSPYVVRRWRSYRRWVVICAIIQATAFLPLVAAALYGSMPTGAVFAAAAIYWGMGMAGGSSWNAWVGAVLPGRIHARYFARRALHCQLALMLALVAGGACLQWSVAGGDRMRGFALVFLAAALSRFLSAYLLYLPSEPYPPERNLVTLQLRTLWTGVQRERIGRMLLYMLAVQSSVQMAGPYFTPYMLHHLDFSYWEYVGLICVAYASKVLCLPWLGQMVDRWGAKRLLWICGLAISPAPALWLVSSSFAYLMLLQILAGVIWGGFELSMLLLLFGSIPRPQRVSILTMFNLANATAVFLGSLAGGVLLSAMGAVPRAYGVLFILSTVARVAALGLLVPLPALARRLARAGARCFEDGTPLHPAERPILSRLPEIVQQGPHWPPGTVADLPQPDRSIQPAPIFGPSRGLRATRLDRPNPK